MGRPREQAQSVVCWGDFKDILEGEYRTVENAPAQETNSGQRAAQGMAASLLAPLIEALLFVADDPPSIERLAQTLMTDEATVEAALALLDEQCAGRGLRVQRKGQRVQWVTAPEAAGVIERFLGLDLSSRLSPAALETLAIISYKQPVTRADVDAVRGVNSDSVIRSLATKGLIEEVGRLDQAGRPILYGTTFEFLQHFGLVTLADLPPLEPAAGDSERERS